MDGRWGWRGRLSSARSNFHESAAPTIVTEPDIEEVLEHARGLGALTWIRGLVCVAMEAERLELSSKRAQDRSIDDSV